MQAADTRPVPGPERATGGSLARRRGGLRREAGSFEAELRGYLQARLRVFSAFTCVAATAMLVLGHLLAAVTGDWEAFELLEPRHHIHGAACLVAGAVWMILARSPRSPRTLRVLDGVMVACTIGSILGIYEVAYHLGLIAMPGLLALFLLIRALIVPSTVRRTLLYSIPAPLLMLGIHLAHGELYVWQDQALPEQYLVYDVFWSQVTVWMAVVLSAFASRLNFSLREKAFEAKQLDQYVIEGVLGRGGMGEVYRARHALLRRPTAVKVLRPELTGARALQRFEKEVQQTARLSHPNTVRIYDYGRTPDGDFFYAMELLDGADLERVVDATGPMPAARAIHVLEQACAALHEAHVKGLIHRDVKPSNFLLCTQGLDRDVVKVMDFGLVKDMESGEENLTRDEEICGSPQTISPEALTNGEISSRSDLYSLGAVGCYLLTGKPPFEGQTVVEIAAAHLHEEPIPPSSRVAGVPEDLERLLLACLSKDPDDRPESAEALRGALTGCADAHGWSQEDARAWWSTHEEHLARQFE